MCDREILTDRFSRKIDTKSHENFDANYVVFDEKTFKVFVVSNSGKTVQEYECISMDETLKLAAKFRSQIELKETD